MAINVISLFSSCPITFLLIFFYLFLELMYFNHSFSTFTDLCNHKFVKYCCFLDQRIIPPTHTHVYPSYVWLSFSLTEHSYFRLVALSSIQELLLTFLWVYIIADQYLLCSYGKLIQVHY